ncbi:unnamed protein product [Arctia plantaginis]|uniref:Dynein axonemal assembly factor 1 homolog n=1 Tax=Arctia plantaginis TaxID=874455 RepID=A0A8S1BG64_ARCPL|nr:unnamed protein product [Arctia plantaginis]
MEGPDIYNDPEFLKQKREELKIFFQDAKLPKEVIERAIENELKPPPQEGVDKPYIAASHPGEVKSEYEVMTGQPFTTVEDLTKPLMPENLKEMLKDNPIIAEKARQIQIMTKKEYYKPIAIPLDQLNLASYADMRKELDSAEGDAIKINNINFKNMLSVMTSACDYKAKCSQETCKDPTKTQTEDEKKEDEEFEAIEKVVSQYTDKSYETRYQETKDMLMKMAENFDEEQEKQTLEIMSDPVLKDSSVQLIKGGKKRSVIKEVEETYAINKDLNISLKGNPVKLNLDGACESKHISKREEVNSKSFQAKLEETEKTLEDINRVLRNAVPSSTLEKPEEKNTKDNKIKIGEEIPADIKKVPFQNDNTAEESESDSQKNNQSEKQHTHQKFDEKMEQTLQNALEDIFEINKKENEDNKDMEVKEMKNLARNIVEGAENLSTLIREDITNKLNSMNELLNDVNEALETSRKSNITYQKIKEEGENLKRNMVKQSISETVKELEESTPMEICTSDPQINDINEAIKKLNHEISGHEKRINQSKALYEQRNDECKTFMNEVDSILLKSKEILHPAKASVDDLSKVDIPVEKQSLNKQEDNKVVSKTNTTVEMKSLNKQEDNKGEKVRKELWDIDFDALKEEREKRNAELKNQEGERNKRIDNLLLDIKDKMKNNKEVLRLANNLLRREENKRKAKEGSCKIEEVPLLEVDEKAQGDNLGPKKIAANRTEKDSKTEETKREEEEQKKKEDALTEKLKQRAFQRKVERELEEMNRAPRMTKEFIRNNCRQHKLYCTPYLNDVLYLHFKGFSKIENLEEYTGLKCIFLENNGIQKIEGLDTLANLKCLYLHYNVVRKIENLDGCPKLDTLNLDHNFVTKIENLDVTPVLHTLSIAHNMLTTVDDLIHLKLCKNLSVLDLSYNRLEDPLIVDVLADMLVLKVLVLSGNPVVRNIPAYRKTLTLRLKELLNLDNRPVFDRDRACAEAWQRGGVQEEVAERRRWIAKDQEKVMQSVRFLINMRDQKKAQREAKEKEDRIAQGLPPKEDENLGEEKLKEKETNDLNTEGTAKARNVGGVPEDILSQSENEDSTSEESSDDGSDANDDKPDTSNIEWSQKDQGKRLVQEIKEEPQQQTSPEDYWCGFRSTLPADSKSSEFVSDFQAMNNLLFGSQPHNQSTKSSEELKTKKGNEKKAEVDNDEEKLAPAVAPKPLIEIIEPNKDTSAESKDKKVLVEDVCSSKSEIVEKTVTETEKNNSNTVEDEEKLGIIVDGNLIIDLDKKTVTTKPNNKERKSTKKIKIKEIPADPEVALTEGSGEADVKKVPEKEEDSKVTSGKGDSNVNNEDIKASTRNNNAEKNTIVKSDDKGISLNSMPRMNNKEKVDVKDEDLDLEPNAEDLEIFAELDREQVERQARIDRGEPAVDPWKLYYREGIEQSEKEECPPAHLINESNSSLCRSTTYRHDNAFDRIALSQLTRGDRPDERKIKLTYVPGATLFEYVDQPSTEDQQANNDQPPSIAEMPEADHSIVTDQSSVSNHPAASELTSLSNNIVNQLPVPDIEFEIGEEKIETASSSSDTLSINIDSDTDTSEDKKVEELIKAPKRSGNRPATAVTKPSQKEMVKRRATSTKETRNRKEHGDEFKGNRDGKKHDEHPGDKNDDHIAERSYTHTITDASRSNPRGDFDITFDMNRSEAKQTIINAINSYEDNRFPSQGVNVSNMAENARIEQNVASEILDRTLQYEERELYRQYDMMTSHAGNIDNRTNAIIEHISDQLENEYTLPEVSRILEVHMDAAEQRWRAGEFVPSFVTEPASTIDEHETTLIPSHNSTLEDTLTEQNAGRMIPSGQSGVKNNLATSNETMVTTDNAAAETSTPICRSTVKPKGKDPEESLENDDLNDSKNFESILSDDIVNVSTDDVFEDCVDITVCEDNAKVEEKFDRVEENYSIEMKLALGIEDAK